MATALTKPVLRKSNTRIFERGNRYVIVAWEPCQHGHSDTFAVRPLGTRKWYRTELGRVIQFVMECHVDGERAALNRRIKALMNSEKLPLRTAKRIARAEMKARK